MSHSPFCAKKIVIFGRPGSGKSTFAHRLHKTTGLPLYHLDKFFYEANWKPRDYQEFLEAQKAILENDGWILDGNNTKSLNLRYAQADLVLYFNHPKVVCYWRVLKRLFYKDKLIDDRAPQCRETIRLELLKYVWHFEDRVRAKIAFLKNQHPHVRFMELNHDGQAVEVVKNLRT